MKKCIYIFILFPLYIFPMRVTSPFPCKELSLSEKRNIILLPERNYCFIDSSNSSHHILVTPCHPCAALAITEKIGSRHKTVVFHVWLLNNLSELAQKAQTLLPLKSTPKISIFSKKMPTEEFSKNFVKRIQEYEPAFSNTQEEWIDKIKNICKKEFKISDESIKSIFNDDMTQKPFIDRSVLIDGSVDNEGFAQFFSYDALNILSCEQIERLQTVNQRSLPFRTLQSIYSFIISDQLSLRILALIYNENKNHALKHTEEEAFIIHNMTLSAGK